MDTQFKNIIYNPNATETFNILIDTSAGVSIFKLETFKNNFINRISFNTTRARKSS